MILSQNLRSSDEVIFPSTVSDIYHYEIEYFISQDKDVNRLNKTIIPFETIMICEYLYLKNNLRKY